MSQSPNKKPRQKKPRKPRVPDEIKTVSDDRGNLLKCFNNGKRIRLFLKLVSEPKSRNIGTINPARKVLEVKRTRALHLFRKNDSYGFNHKLLSDSKLFENVRLMDDHGEWLIPKQYILDNGSFLHFLAHGGFELQIFLPLDKMNDFKKQPKI